MENRDSIYCEVRNGRHLCDVAAFIKGERESPRFESWNECDGTNKYNGKQGKI